MKRIVTALRQRLADTPLRVKLSIGLGTSIVGLLIIATIAIYTIVANQLLVGHTLTRQRQLADLASEINNHLLTIQNQAFEFYDTWATTGFESAGQGGFEKARGIYVTSLQDRIGRIQNDIHEIQQLESDEQTLANLEQILSSMDAYETSLLQMSDQMESLGFIESGEIGQMRAILAELHGKLDGTGLESLRIVLLQISEHEKEYLLHSDLASARLTQELTGQLVEQIAALDDDQLAPADKAQLIILLERYRDHFLAAASHLNLLDRSREVLTDQSDLTGMLVGNLFERQQDEFGTTVEQLQRRQSNATFTVTGLALLTLLVSISIVYVIAGQIIQPVQALEEAAGRLGAGDLDVRATVHGRDEIGTTAATFNLMADRLQETLAGLEQQVADRTRELKQHSAYLMASAEVGHAVSSVLDADRLIQQVVTLILERFGLYYVGLFLADEAGEWATLRAGTGEAGRMMLARRHRIRVGEGMIGWSLANARARIALDVGEDAARLASAELPDTRSEAALPLRSRGRVIGALTVQSDQPAAFDQDTVVVLQTMADQVAVALDNAQLFTESRAALEAERRAYGDLSREAWAELLRVQADMAYRSDESGVTEAGDIWRPEMEQALQEGKIIQGDGADADAELPLAIPIKVRGNVIGVLDTYKPAGEGTWSPEEITLLETLAGQLGTSLESARLYQDTQHRATRERLTRELTDKMRGAADVDSLMQTTIQEMIAALGASSAFVQLSTLPESRSDGRKGKGTDFLQKAADAASNDESSRKG